MDRTLLLNQGYEPLRAISWQRAFCLVALGKVEVVEHYDRTVRSAQRAFQVPAVVRLLAQIRRYEQQVKFSRQNVLFRDDWTCQYCGEAKPKQQLTYDHVVPKAQGGRTCWENIVTACGECNRKKGARTPDQAGMRLRNHPHRPNWAPLFLLQTSTRNAIPNIWLTYCSWLLRSGAG